jgi:hypothetical protein
LDPLMDRATVAGDIRRFSAECCLGLCVALLKEVVCDLLLNISCEPRPVPGGAMTSSDRSMGGLRWSSVCISHVLADAPIHALRRINTPVPAHGRKGVRRVT